MGEYGREQRNQLSRVIANGEVRSKQLKGIVDNRFSSFMQFAKMNESYSNTLDLLQLSPNKIVLRSARVHYSDGWGNRYGIMSDGVLKANVPNAVTGNGNIELGWYDAPENEQPIPPDGTRKEKYCEIDYRDGHESNSTAIYHCGPSGRANWYDV